MKNLKLLLFLLAMCYTCVISAQTGKKSPVTLKWTLQGNYAEGGRPYHNATFSIVNNSNKPLESNWVLYFCQMPGRIVADDSQPIKLETVKSTYFRLSPSAHYKNIAAGDSATVQYRIGCSMVRMSSAPEGAFIVISDKNGKEQKPVSVPVVIAPFTQPNQWSNPARQEPPYPSGDLVYEQNLPFSKPCKLVATDIFPSLKNVVSLQGTSKILKNIKLVYDNSLRNLATLLETQMSVRTGCTFNKKMAATTVRLIQNGTNSNDERYILRIEGNSITIEGASQHALFNGMQSLIAIVSTQKLPGSLNNMVITDYPDLKYRGFMLDVSRDFTRKADILKLIDILASYKMNVLHLHMGDDEGWRLQIPGIEELTDVGARRGYTKDERTCLYPAYCGGWDANNLQSAANGYYTKNDFIDILRYAQARFITIIPEFDTPGHSRAAIKAMDARYDKYIKTNPDKAKEYLLSETNDHSKYSGAQAYDDNILNVALPSTYRFISKVIDELCAMYKEAGVPLHYLHFGGDEVPSGAWMGSALCSDFMKERGLKTTHELKDYFIEQVIKMLKAKGIELGAWQEVLVTNGKVNPEFTNEKILSYCWDTNGSSQEIPYNLANAGYPIILSNVANLYFDLAYCKHPQERGLDWGGFLSERESFNLLPFNLYASIRKDMNGKDLDMSNISANKISLNPDKVEMIRGIQGQLWAETIRNFNMVESYLLPKMFGLIERAWNAHPAWEKEPDSSNYLNDLALYYSKIALREFPRLSRENINFHLALPGLKIIDGKLYANTRVPGASIRYTTDGTEPNAKSSLWTTPVSCNAKQIKAKAFYLGKESITTILNQ